MIRIVKRTHTGLPCGEVLDILADTEEDITALGDVVADGFDNVKAGPGSFAYTADMGVVYQLSPSREWKKAGGNSGGDSSGGSGGSGGAFVVNLTPQEEGKESWFIADKTFEETLVACQAGRSVAFSRRMDAYGYEMAEIATVVMYEWSQDEDDGTIYASLSRYNGDGMTFVIYEFTNNGSVMRSAKDYGDSAPA